MDIPEESSANQVPSLGCGFWFLWILATVLGTGSGWLAGWWASFRSPAVISTLVLGLLAGTVLGAMQWLVIRQVLPGAGRWILASAAGWGIGLYLGAGLPYLLDLSGLAFNLAIGAAIGLSSGLLQWLVLRRRSPYAGWWILASVFSWTSALMFYQAGLSAAGFYYGLLVGIVTGVALIGIFGFATQEEIPALPQ